MMKKIRLFYFIAFFISINIWSQQDSIFINAKLSEDHKILMVQQEILYHNPLKIPINKIKLLNWISAYKKENTPLVKRKLEDRKSDLYFAKEEELGFLQNLEVKIDHIIYKDLNPSKENIYIPLKKELLPNATVKIILNYQLSLPDAKFTNYGVAKESVILKYFFLVPDTFEQDSQIEKYFLDTHETQNAGNFWSIFLDLGQKKFLKSNLTETKPHLFTGVLNQDPEILISDSEKSYIKTMVDQKEVILNFGYLLDETEKSHLENLLPQQLTFIKSILGEIPNQIFISDKFKTKEDFFGNNDIKFWKLHFQMFTDKEKTDLDYFSILSKYCVENSFISEKEKDHWFANGIKTYLEIQYLKTYYKDYKLLGMLPETVKIFGIKPLKAFYASKLNITDRYGVFYQYIMKQNLDQKIAEPFSKLSNLNEMVISNFESGMLLNFIAEKMSEPNFNAFLNQYFNKSLNQKINTQNFLEEMALATENSSGFLKEYIEHKNRTNFRLKNYKKNNDEYLIKVSKNTNQEIPFNLETKTDEGKTQTYWFDTVNKKSTANFEVPQSNADKIMVNDGYIFPEVNLRDNYKYTHGFFANTKKLKFKFMKDIPNPEYNEIYVGPKLFFNVYDNFLLGINFKNQSLFNDNFNYSFTPYYSIGTKKIVGSGAVSYNFMPAESFYNSLQFGVSGSYFHYDYKLAYRKISLYSRINLNKEPRSTVNRGFGLSYDYYRKDLSPNADPLEYSKYQLWNAYFAYSDGKLIHENYLVTNFQHMEDFNKIALDSYYRWEYAQNKKISFRLFTGIFLNNKTKNNTFDFGISRISNYSFNYSLLGQSATSGFLSQQYVLADGGFKSFIDKTVNQWIVSTNIDSQIWKIFNVYGDIGMYKNKSFKPKFIWDTGIKVRLIQDFFEVYFPLFSTNGFEPNLGHYNQRIRFSMVFNFNSFVSYFRRGWF